MRKAIILSMAASLLLSSCAAVEDIKRLTADDSSYSQTEDARQDAEKTAENDPTQSGAASMPSRPKKAADDEFSVPEHDPIPAVPDVPAGTPDDSIMPIELTDDTGYTDEYGIFHYSDTGILYELRDMAYEACEDKTVDGWFYPDEFSNAAKMLYNVYPDIFWTKYFYYECTDDGKTNIHIDLIDGIDTDKIPEMNEQINQKADEIAALANEMPTDYEKIKFVHDYLIENTHYEWDKQNEAKNTAYSCLIEGESACYGYTTAFQMIMQRLDIVSGLCYGYTPDFHVWNYVWFDDAYYWIDVSADDWEKDENDRITGYTYFMTTDDHCLNGRTTDDEYNYFTPECKSTTHDFFAENKLILERYDFDTVNAICFASQDNHAEIQFTTKAQFTRAKNELFNDGMAWNISALDPGEEIYVLFLSDFNIIILYWK